jgi:hypothetical protein
MTRVRPASLRSQENHNHVDVKQTSDERQKVSIVVVWERHQNLEHHLSCALGALLRPRRHNAVYQASDQRDARAYSQICIEADKGDCYSTAK